MAYEAIGNAYGKSVRPIHVWIAGIYALNEAGVFLTIYIILYTTCLQLINLITIKVVYITINYSSFNKR